MTERVIFLIFGRPFNQKGSFEIRVEASDVEEALMLFQTEYNHPSVIIDCIKRSKITLG